MCQNRSGDTGAAKATSKAPRPSATVRRAGRSGYALALLAAAGLAGCVVVKPYQREHLVERCMAPGFGDATELKFRSHWEGSRQGGEGGFGTAGGGCGCN